ncbi:hypothetical protein JCM19300_4273 [Algibacter lectus]|uniref:Uncharacterized protein n=1 Tax=Algibacter lectus TaxID=221126 RepID=A0A090W1C1_9FLAO|nr:hypothetical protein JCM19300_4273 [Algibacter lectus]
MCDFSLHRNDKRFKGKFPVFIKQKTPYQVNDKVFYIFNTSLKKLTNLIYFK